MSYFITNFKVFITIFKQSTDLNPGVINSSSLNLEMIRDIVFKAVSFTAQFSGFLVFPEKPVAVTILVGVN
jgi:hypothetical protein